MRRRSNTDSNRYMRAWLRNRPVIYASWPSNTMARSLEELPGISFCYFTNREECRISRAKETRQKLSSRKWQPSPEASLSTLNFNLRSLVEELNRWLQSLSSETSSLLQKKIAVTWKNSLSNWQTSKVFWTWWDLRPFLTVTQVW